MHRSLSRTSPLPAPKPIVGSAPQHGARGGAPGFRRTVSFAPARMDAGAKSSDNGGGNELGHARYGRRPAPPAQSPDRARKPHSISAALSRLQQQQKQL